MGLLSAVISGATSLIGGAVNRRSAAQAADQNAALQREFAQNGIRWKVADAKAAGLHPLAALGASTASASPVYTATDSGISQAGQGIARAISARQTQEERDHEKRMRDLAIRKEMAEIALLESQTQQNRSNIMSSMNQANNVANMRAAAERALMNQPGQPPATPRLDGVPRTAPTGDVEVVPSEVETSVVYNPGISAGSPPSVQYYQNADGKSYTVFPSQNLIDATSEGVVNNAVWLYNLYKSGMAANNGDNDNFFPPRTPEMIEKGEYWRFNPLTRTVYPTKVKPDDPRKLWQQQFPVKGYPRSGTGTGR